MDWVNKGCIELLIFLYFNIVKCIMIDMVLKVIMLNFVSFIKEEM